jgi:hypothetical protein
MFPSMPVIYPLHLQLHCQSGPDSDGDSSLRAFGGHLYPPAVFVCSIQKPHEYEKFLCFLFLFLFIIFHFNIYLRCARDS